MAPAPEPTPLNTESRIVEAAHEVFLQKGLTGARMQEIADRAGINKALLHYYFRSKDKLFEFILGRAINRLLPRVLAVMESDDDLLEKIRRIVYEYVGFISRHSYLPLFIVNEINRNPDFLIHRFVQEERLRLTGFAQQIEEAAATGRIRPISAAALLMNTMSMCIFPFLAKPVVRGLFLLDEDAFAREMEKRRTEVAEFIIAALRP